MFAQNETMLKIAHRGASGYKPENTLAAFQKALDMQVDGIELDVHLTGDGAILVIHDETLERTTNGVGRISEMSFDDVRKFKCDDNNAIPTLAETLDLIAAKCFVNIELKGDRTALSVVELIRHNVDEKKWMYSQFIVSSFDWNALQEVRKTNPEIPIGVLTTTDLDLAIGFAEFIKAQAIHPYFHLLTAKNVSIMQEKGFAVYAWTVNEPDDIAQVKKLSVNGIITDFPDRI